MHASVVSCTMSFLVTCTADCVEYDVTGSVHAAQVASRKVIRSYDHVCVVHFYCHLSSPLPGAQCNYCMSAHKCMFGPAKRMEAESRKLAHAPSTHVDMQFSPLSHAHDTSHTYNEHSDSFSLSLSLSRTHTLMS